MWLVRADLTAGTLLLAQPPLLRWGRVRRTLLPLPSTGRADAVTSIRLVSFSRQLSTNPDVPIWQMLLLGRSGQILAATKCLDQEPGRQMWPVELLAPLEQAGIAVTEERFARDAEFRRAYPGAGGSALARTPLRRALTGLALALIIVLIIAVAVIASS